jgi:gamma-glutamyl-gamma-aminobutyraldehyde dehydrogenase
MWERSVFDLSFWQQRANRQTFIDTALIGGHSVKASVGGDFRRHQPSHQPVARPGGGLR